MANVYCYKRPITNTGTISYDTKTLEQWTSDSANLAVIAFEDSDGNLTDLSEFVSEFQIQHNDIDGEKAGRDKCSGRMVRVFKANKHTLTIKMVNHLPQSIAYKAFSCVRTTTDRQSFWARYQGPCGSGLQRKEFYCSTINYGAQRYDRNAGKCYYDGMSFNIIEM